MSINASISVVEVAASLGSNQNAGHEDLASRHPEPLFRYEAARPPGRPRGSPSRTVRRGLGARAPISEGLGELDGGGAGWCVYEPGSARHPTVTGGEALVLYLLPDGEIDCTK